MSELLESKLSDRISAINPMRTHSRNLSWGGQGTPLSRKLSASPKVVSALASATSLHSRTSSFKADFGPELALDFRIGKHASGTLSMDLFRVPEDRMQQNLDLLDMVVDKNLSKADIASAVANVLPHEDIGFPTPASAFEEFVPIVIAHSLPKDYGTEAKGEEATFDYRIFLTDSGKVGSFWHDVPLDNGDGTVNFVCEIPKDTKAKMEVATKEEHTPIKQDVKKGKLRDYPYPINWNYGMLPRTWEDPQQKHEELGGITGDNDPVDVVEIGSEQLVSGQVYKVKVLGAYAMIDEGELDWKILAIRADDPMARHLNDIEDVERRMEGVLEAIMVWFRDYKMPDGKPANQFGYDGKPQNREAAGKVIEETHESYQSLMDGRRENDGKLALA